MDTELTTLLSCCIMTMFTTALILLSFLDYNGVAMKKADAPPKTVKKAAPPPPQKAASEVLDAPSGWGDKDFAAKYGSGGESGENKSGEAPSRCAQLIRKRRSIFPKDFVSDQLVELSTIEEMLAAANWAPTHGKTEPWRFVVAGPEAIQKIMDIRDSFMVEKLTQAGDTAGLEKHTKKIAKKRKELKNCSAVIFIIVKRVPNSKGGFMPEWEEVAAVSCAVQNLHIQITSRWAEGIGGYWSSGGHDSWLQAPALGELLGARDGSEGNLPGRDLVLGGFYLGICPQEKMDQYRSKRGDIADKVKWLY